MRSGQDSAFPRLSECGSKDLIRRIQEPPPEMANADHLKTLRQGVDAWNAWRKQHPVKPDLSQADLREADLNGADLNGANLRGANLISVSVCRPLVCRPDVVA